MKTAVSLNMEEKLESQEILNYQIRSCERCGLSVSRKHALPGEGNLNSGIMIVGLSPGAKENVANRMFVGPAGHVLDKLFHASGINREEIFMTNLVKCMLPGNRKPEANEIAMCGLFLDDEISLIQPKLIVPLGKHASIAILGRFQDNSVLPGNVGRIEFGKLLERNGQLIYPLNHPASLLYNPSYEADTVRKYQRLKTFL